MRPYAERRAARIERLRAGAERARREAESKLESARLLADAIPFGQPILVGHHSERRHRRDAERIHARTGAGLAKLEESRALARRADAAEASTAISSDDPDALALLRARAVALEAARGRWKAINAAARKGAAALVGLDLTDDERRALAFAPCGTGFKVTNLSAELRRTQARIADIERRAALPALEQAVFGAIRVERDREANRVRVMFPGKPGRETIADLKSHGFRFAPSAGAWQRHNSEQAWFQASRIAQSADGGRV